MKKSSLLKRQEHHNRFFIFSRQLTVGLSEKIIWMWKFRKQNVIKDKELSGKKEKEEKKSGRRREVTGWSVSDDLTRHTATWRRLEWPTHIMRMFTFQRCYAEFTPVSTIPKQLQIVMKAKVWLLHIKYYFRNWECRGKCQSIQGISSSRGMRNWIAAVLCCQCLVKLWELGSV